MMSALVPRVLIVSLRGWWAAARLPKAFARAGFHVSTLSFPGLPLLRARDVAAHYLMPARGEDLDLIVRARAALIEARPTIVVPTDESSVELLQAVAATASKELPADDPLLVMLRDSLGEFHGHAILRDRRAFMDLAEKTGVRIPERRVVHNREEAVEFAERHGGALVLKAEESCAGMGVFICRDLAAVEKALAQLASKSASALPNGVLAQAVIEGATAMRVVLAYRGEVLGGLSAFKRETFPRSTGPSSVVEFIDHPEMASTARAIVREAGYSGFASLDYMVEESGAAHLIELNARPTPISHLGAHLGLDLCARLAGALRGEPASDAEPTGLPRKVALFPQEWTRDPNSPHFADSFHDVPWEDPELLQECVAAARVEMHWDNWRYQEERRLRIRSLLSELDLPSR